jgi:hypothetical protein
MVNVRSDLETRETNEEKRIGYQKIRCHMIFYVNLGENFRRKARYVAGGHTTETLASLTYSSVVARDSVRIAFLLAALNGPTNMFMDNEAVYNKFSCPESTIKKKHLSIACHRCREAVTAGTVRIAKEETETNLSDLFTKIFLDQGEKHS